MTLFLNESWTPSKSEAETSVENVPMCFPYPMYIWCHTGIVLIVFSSNSKLVTLIFFLNSYTNDLHTFLTLFYT